MTQAVEIRTKNVESNKGLVRARGAPAAIVELPMESEITSRDAEEFYRDPKSD